MQQSLFTDPREKITATEARQRESEQRKFVRTHARKNQPTSTEAAERIAPVVLSHVQHVAELVNHWPGLTSNELTAKQEVAQRLGIGGTPLDRTEMGRRCPDAASKEHGYLIRVGPKRKCKVGKGNAVTWWPNDFTDGDIEREMTNG